MCCQEHFCRGWEILHTSISTSFLKIRISSFTDDLIYKRNDIISKYTVPHASSEVIVCEYSDAHISKHIHSCTYTNMYTYMHTKYIHAHIYTTVHTQRCPYIYLCTQLQTQVTYDHIDFLQKTQVLNVYVAMETPDSCKSQYLTAQDLENSFNDESLSTSLYYVLLDVCFFE